MSMYKYVRISTQSNSYQNALGKMLLLAFILQPILILFKNQQFYTYSCKPFSMYLSKCVHLQVKTFTCTTFLYCFVICSFYLQVSFRDIFSPFGYTLFLQLEFAVVPLLIDRRFVQFGSNVTVHTNIPTEQNSKVEFLGKSFSTQNPHQVLFRVDETRT